MGGMAIAGKIIKISSMPIAGKLGAVVGMGAASLIGYKMVQNKLAQNNNLQKPNISLNADKISGNVSSPKKVVYLQKAY